MTIWRNEMIKVETIKNAFSPPDQQEPEFYDTVLVDLQDGGPPVEVLVRAKFDNCGRKYHFKKGQWVLQ